jgi:hypothetical protein
MIKKYIFLIVVISFLFSCVSTDPQNQKQSKLPDEKSLESKFATGKVTNTFTGKTWTETIKLDELGNNRLSLTFESNLPDRPFFVFLDKYGLQYDYHDVQVNGKILIVHNLSLKKLFEEHEPSVFMAVMDITNQSAMWNCSFKFIND